MFGKHLCCLNELPEKCLCNLLSWLLELNHCDISGGKKQQRLNEETVPRKFRTGGYAWRCSRFTIRKASYMARIQRMVGLGLKRRWPLFTSFIQFWRFSWQDFRIEAGHVCSSKQILLPAKRGLISHVTKNAHVLEEIREINVIRVC